MTGSTHTYGPECHLARTVDFSVPKDVDDPPPLKAQFFYSSPLPIDDPLSAIPPPADSDTKNVRHQPRPFSAYDNKALESAWSSLASAQSRKHHNKLRLARMKPLTKAQARRRMTIISEISAKHRLKHLTADRSTAKDRMKTKLQTAELTEQKPDVDQPSSNAATGSSSATMMEDGCDCCSECQTDACAASATAQAQNHIPYSSFYDMRGESSHHNEISPVIVCCAELENDVKNAQSIFTGVLKRRESKTHQELLIRDIMIEVKKQTGLLGSGQGSFEGQNNGLAQGDAAIDQPSLKEKIVKPALKKVDHQGSNSRDASPGRNAAVRELVDATAIGNRKAENSDGRDFHKRSKDHTALAVDHDMKKPISISSLDSVVNQQQLSSGSKGIGTTGNPFKRAPSRKNVPTSVYDDSNVQDRGASHTLDTPVESVNVHRCKAYTPHKSDPEIAVGLSRLHLVKLPALHMTPIYWSPVHDVAAVTRGTWFYRETMYPVEPAVANQLEIGYKELKPWSETWADEIKSAIDVGAAGEEKVTHRLWPEESIDGKTSPVDPADDQPGLATDPWCAARCFHGEVAAEGSIEAPRPTEKLPATAEIVKKYPNSHVVYRDARIAFILKPSLQPSEYFGRRPVAKIIRNMTVGIPVVRGFEWKAWNRLHPTKYTMVIKNAEQAASVASTAAINSVNPSASACPGCRNDEKRTAVSDLVLVVHGIGQKLSERMESFHFTHAINAFRRSVNVELGNEGVKKVLRADLGGVMVLPVNWRSNLTFEEGGPGMIGDEFKAQDAEEFNLKDITPDTIPAVRNLISDVLLDIPYYLSQHKARMIEALITEANRVYRLWCKNNPEFQKNGRVHLIAHSLGSAMALDVLSKQPTSVGIVDVMSKKMQRKHFEFNTTNLFFAGSPAGFFLLLEKGKLIPRNGRSKPDADLVDDTGEAITGYAGTFGCLAVDNLYNVMHYNDPIAYRLNATVDPMYAASLKPAEVPASTTGWLETFGNAFRVFTPGSSSMTNVDANVGQLAPKPQVTRLPSQLEMEVHDFTREEIAEKKFYLLNDNGQIDYFLATGGGPLEIQYLNMLGAHSSYWTSPDFVRMLVTEVGRKPGRTNAMPNMKAVKASTHKKMGEK